MKSNKCPNCGAPLPHMVQGVDYSCSYCGSAVVPSDMPLFIVNTLDKITDAPIVAAKPVYAPGRYAAVASVKVAMLIISAFTVGLLFVPLAIVMLVGAIVSIVKAVYWIVKWRMKVNAQAKFTEEQLQADDKAISEYYMEQNKAGKVAVKWLWSVIVCTVVIIAVFMLRGKVDDMILGAVLMVTAIVALPCIAFLWMKALAWAKDPQEETVSV